LQHNNHAILQYNNHATLQWNNNATIMQHNNHATQQSCNLEHATITQPSTQQSRNLALQHNIDAILQWEIMGKSWGNHGNAWGATLQSNNHATLQATEQSHNLAT
jgi:hypothetical protein